MAVSNYVIFPILEAKSQWRSLVASSISYVTFEPTHLDSVHGIYLSVAGVTTGAGTPMISVEQSIDNTNWVEVTAAVAFKGSPVSLVVKCIPTLTETLYPFLRLKITTDATSALVITGISRTIRGVN